MSVSEQSPIGRRLEQQLPTLLNALENTRHLDFKRQPGLVLITLGGLMTTVLEISTLMRVFGASIETLEPLEYIASLAAAVALLIIGAVLHLAADRQHAQSAESERDRILELAALIDQPPATQAAARPSRP
jgi:uncharacterized membrane protein